MRRESATTATGAAAFLIAWWRRSRRSGCPTSPTPSHPGVLGRGQRGLWIGSAWIVIGVGLETLRRDRRHVAGLLLAAAGVAWLIAAWADPAMGSPLLFTIGLLGVAAYGPLVAHGAFAIAAARPWPRSAAAILALGYLAAVVLVGIVPTLFYDPVLQGCLACPSNLLAVVGAPDLATTAIRLGLAILVVWAGAVTVLFGSHVQRASDAARRVEVPVLVPAVVFVALFAVQAARAVDGAAFDDDGAAVWLWRLQAVAMTAVALGVAYQWVRARRTRGRVARYVIDLAGSELTTSLGDVLATLVGDPELRVAYPLPGGRWVDARGHETSLAERPGRTLTPVRIGRETVAVLDHRQGIESDRTLMDEVVRAARLGLERERLQAAARATLEELRASRLRVVEADDAERHQLERDLHDGAQQRLLSLGLSLRLAEAGLTQERDATTVEVMVQAQGEVARALAETRRIAHGIYPASLADEGLAGGIESVLEASAIPVTVREIATGRFPSSVERTAYLVAVDAIGATGARRASLSVRAGRRPSGRRGQRGWAAAGLDRGARGPRHGARWDARHQCRRRHGDDPSGDPMRIVIADDELILREGLARLLTEAGVDVAGTAADPVEARRIVDATLPDVVILDIRMPPTRTDEGLVAAEQIREAHPEMGVLVLSQHLESRYAWRVLEQRPEGVGYLLKDRVSDVAVLTDALHRIAEGECVLDPTIVCACSGGPANDRR